jgi:uncharacterized membrane-anchored protein
MNMNPEKLPLLLFLLLAVVQLFVPANMVFQQEQVLESGTEYRFKTRPIDPVDPFRGRYITLDFEANRFSVDTTFREMSGKDIWVFIEKDAQGYARVSDVWKTRPENTNDSFIKAQVRSYIGGQQPEIFLQYPFQRFYMEETKAPEAEKAYWEAMRDSSQTAYALVRVKDGNASLVDVVVDGVSVKEMKSRE